MFKNKEEYLTKQQQMKRSFLKGIAIGTIAVICVAGTYQFVVIPKAVSSKTQIATTAKKENQVQVWALSKDVKQGDGITKDMLKKVTVDKTISPSDAILDDKIENKVFKMNLKSNSILTDSMLLLSEDKLTTDLRKQDYSHITLNVNLEPNMYVDIRFKKKDGTDFIVASKKKVIDRRDDILIINITEKERQYINNATVLAALTEATMYTTIYVDGENQPAAKVTYEINEEVKSMIDNDPNIVKASEIQIKDRNESLKANSDSEENKDKKVEEKKDDSKKEKDGDKKPVFVE